ncbi:MAG TPA: tRNA lysidine(34) synthetase TilS [Dehalococcoidia bacterium]|nr:tRNA lysidine(34) synthetase TilS [Dehalococcoidia bacterium]
MTGTFGAARGPIGGAEKLRRDIQRRIARYCDQQALWPPDGRLLVAVSGGPDSSAMLLALAALASRRKLELIAAYFDHRLRGARASRTELRAVGELARRCGVELVSGGGDVARLQREQRLTLEEAARRARYDFLASVAEGRGVATVAVGHTLDDQAETVLMHILRGSGLTGLGGMHPRSRWPSGGHDGLTLVRPLLGLRRQETEAYCRASGWQPVEDASNRSRAFLRNQVRNDLMPELRRYNPRIEESLARLADAAREDEAALMELAAEAVAPSGEGIALDRRRLRSMPAGVRRHAVRLALLRLLGDLQGFNERHIVAVERAATGPAGGRRLDLPRGVTAAARAGVLILRRGGTLARPPLPPEGVRLSVPGEARLGGLVVAAGDRPLAGAIASVRADAAALGPELCVRRWRAGDRMQPAGMSGTKKVQDIFVDARVPRDERAAIPVFEGAGGIAWLGGLRLAEWAKPREGSPAVVLSYGAAEN